MSRAGSAGLCRRRACAPDARSPRPGGGAPSQARLRRRRGGRADACLRSCLGVRSPRPSPSLWRSPGSLLPPDRRLARSRWPCGWCPRLRGSGQRGLPMTWRSRYAGLGTAASRQIPAIQTPEPRGQSAGAAETGGLSENTRHLAPPPPPRPLRLLWVRSQETGKGSEPEAVHSPLAHSVNNSPPADSRSQITGSTPGKGFHFPRGLRAWPCAGRDAQGMKDFNLPRAERHI